MKYILEICAMLFMKSRAKIQADILWLWFCYNSIPKRKIAYCTIGNYHRIHLLVIFKIRNFSNSGIFFLYLFHASSADPQIPQCR